VLLLSRPDTVHKVLLRKTQPSTPLLTGRPHRIKPQYKHHPRYSGLRVQGAATSPASTKLYDYFIMFD